MTKREKQDTARTILVLMAKLGGTPISVLAEFILAHDISLNVAQQDGMNQATHDRIHLAFRAAWSRMMEKRRKVEAQAEDLVGTIPPGDITQFVLSGPRTVQEAMRERANRRKKA